MRSKESGFITVTYPDEVMFAFNPNYIIIDDNFSRLSAEVTIFSPSTQKSFTLNPSLHVVKKGKLIISETKLYISKIVQKLVIETGDWFTLSRSYPVAITVKVGEDVVSEGFTCIYGSLDVSQRPNQIGSFLYDVNEVAFVRRVRWFKNFPFVVSAFVQTSSTMKKRYDRNTYSDEVVELSKGFNDFDPNDLFPDAERVAVMKVTPDNAEINGGVFDDTHDYTFKRLGEEEQIIRLYVDNSTEGHYLRWIDPIGQIQYWLFTFGKDSINVKEGESIDTEVEFEGFNYGNVKHVFYKSRTREIKVGAVNLSTDEAEYVKTVMSSIFCQMYMPNGSWIPVNIKAGTLETREKDHVHDLEFTIEVPINQPQTR